MWSDSRTVRASGDLRPVATFAENDDFTLLIIPTCEGIFLLRGEQLSHDHEVMFDTIPHKLRMIVDVFLAVFIAGVTLLMVLMDQPPLNEPLWIFVGFAMATPFLLDVILVKRRARRSHSA